MPRRLEVIKRLGAGLEEASSRQPVLVMVDVQQWPPAIAEQVAVLVAQSAT